MKKNVLIIVSVVAIILLALGGWFWYGKGKSGEANLDHISVENTKKPVNGDFQNALIFNRDIMDTSQWETYGNKSIGFEIKYPKNIYKLSENQSLPTGVVFTPINDALKKQYGDIQVYVLTLEESLFSGKSDEEIAAFKKSKNGQPLSWKDDVELYQNGTKKNDLIKPISDGLSNMGQKFISTEYLHDLSYDKYVEMTLVSTDQMFFVTYISPQGDLDTNINKTFLQMVMSFKTF